MITYPSYLNDWNYCISDIALFAFNYTPEGWISCEGQTLNTADYGNLFSLLGNQYGGDGVNTFSLPNLKGAEPTPYMKYCICAVGGFPLKENSSTT